MTENTTPAAIALKKDVGAAVEGQDSPNGTENVRSLVVRQLAQAEISRRTGVLADALTKRDALAKTLAKIKPTFLASTCQDTGKETFHYTKKEIEERNKGGAKLDKLDKAIDAAITTPNGENYGKLKEVAAKS